MFEVKAIETEYKGYRFRSRLEARWAVYFDAMGIGWEYESEGYELKDGSRYLPDFYFPLVNTFAEVKPQITKILGVFDENTASCLLDEFDKAVRFAQEKYRRIIFLHGVPSVRPYYFVDYSDQDPKDSWNSDNYYQCDIWDSSHWGYNDEKISNCVITTYKCYFKENRFYYGVSPDYCNYFDLDIGVKAARSARFEFGETPA